jgi:hypothetical protein
MGVHSIAPGFPMVAWGMIGGIAILVFAMQLKAVE